MKQKKQLHIVLISLLVVILLSSCGEPSSGRQGDGLEISFLDGTPPSTLYVQKGQNDIPFELIVELKNRGSYPRNDIGSLNGRLYLTGFDKAIIDVSSAFAPGQIYVAISRLSSLNGLVLNAPIPVSELAQDGILKEYAKNKKPSGWSLYPYSIAIGM